MTTMNAPLPFDGTLSSGGAVPVQPGPILTILHQESSTPGRVGQILQARGHRLAIRRPALGDALPRDLSAFGGLVVFGGPMSANDPDPYIAAETDLLARALDGNVPTLAICLGAQMLVCALGGTVGPRGENWAEIGWYPLRATSAGKESGLPWPSHVYQWHREGFDLPSGATCLASSDAYPTQAFSIGSALAVQFHAELTLAMMCRWTVKGAHCFQFPGARGGRHAHLQGRLRHDGPLRYWLEEALLAKFGVAGRNDRTLAHKSSGVESSGTQRARRAA